MRFAEQVLAAILASTEIAAASPGTESRATALAAEGHKLGAAGDYEAACEKLTKAIALMPNAVEAMFDLGVCNEGLQKYATAASWFRRARTFAHSHGLGKIEVTANSRANAIADRVAVIKLSFPDDPPRGVKVTIDGYPVSVDSYEHVELDRGRHAIDVMAPKYTQFHTDVDVEDSQTETIQVVLERKGRSEHEPDADEPSRSHLARNLAIGGSAALVASAAVVIYARVEYARCVSNNVPLATCPDGRNGVDATNYYRNLARWVGTPLFGAGVALVGYATYLYVTTTPPPNKVAWLPIVDADHIGIAAVGRF